jgi:hypothetical protein
MRACVFAFILSVASALSSPAIAEICHSLEHQFGKTRTCASSVLAPQGERTYGPNHLIIGEDGAWCEGAAGPGIGETVTIHMDPRPRFRTISITNGYARTADTFRRNGRVKRAHIEAEGGYKTAVTLKDTREPQRIRIPTSRALWIKFTIAEVYPGASGNDTCVTWLSVDHEELNN